MTRVLLASTLLALAAPVAAQSCFVHGIFTLPTQGAMPCGDSPMQTPGFVPHVHSTAIAPPATYTQTSSFLYSAIGSGPFIIGDWTATGAQDRFVMRPLWPGQALSFEGIPVSYRPSNGTPPDNTFVTFWLWLPSTSTSPISTPYGVWANPDPTQSLMVQYETDSTVWAYSANLLGEVSFSSAYVTTTGNFAGLVGQTINAQVMIQCPNNVPGDPPMLLIGPVESVTVL